MKVKGHHPLQESVGRMLFGVEGVPPDVARRMVNQTASMAAEYVQGIEAQRDRAHKALQRLFDTQNGPPVLGGYKEQEWKDAMVEARAALQEVEV